MIKKETNVERFYAWMLKMNNVHLADNARMEKAYNIVANN